MSETIAGGVGVVGPDEAWEALRTSRDALLVDVRTRAEWTFVGVADLSDATADQAFIEWTGFPSSGPNPAFLSELDAAVSRAAARRVYFICRSGGRSMAAASAAAAHFAAQGKPVACVNVAEGFEGDLDASGHRSALGGWKARGLPWRQS